MPSRSKGTHPKRKAPTARPAANGRKPFGSSKARGLQLEFIFRRRYPLDDSSSEFLRSAIRKIVRDNRKGYKWFFVSIRLKVLGGLYQVHFVAPDPDEATWEEQWVSTPVTNHIDVLLDSLDTLLSDTVEFQLAGRPAWVERFRVVLFKNRKEADANA